MLNEYEQKLTLTNKEKSKLEKQNQEYQTQINQIKKTLSDKENECNKKNIEYLDEIFKVLGNKYSYEFVEVPQIINA